MIAPSLNRKTAEIPGPKTCYGTFLQAWLARQFRTLRIEDIMIKDRFSRIVFLVAGIYGIIVLAPGYFGEKILGQKMPPAITHPEFYYGFFGVALAWQVAFLIIASDPQRFRPIIFAAILEKLTYVVASLVLLALGRVPLLAVLGGAGDFVLGTLFTISYMRLKPAQPAA
jgi:hypothetical protein